MVTHPYSILTVCTGNICRSPVAERLLARSLGPDVAVASAGIAAVVGGSIDPHLAVRLDRDGVVWEDFRARQITEAIVRSADLVLVMTRDHRARVVDLVPAAVRRTFTLTEFAALADKVAVNTPGVVPAEFLRALVPAAAGQRMMAGLAPDDFDIDDPYGGPDEDHARAYAEIADAVTRIRCRVRAAGALVL